MTATEAERAAEEGRRTLETVRTMKDEFVDFLTSLALVESPTNHPETIKDVHDIVGPALEDLGFEVSFIRGKVSGDHLYAAPRRRAKGAPAQLLVGHTDTVWPLKTLERMPVEVVDGRLHGPGTLDMKGGLTMMLFALRALRQLDLEPEVTPIVFMNADEEVGSPDSRPWVARLAKVVNRALILEPGLGLDGHIKTARKGVGRVDIRVTGKAAHAGLEPELGASAISELAHLIQELHALNDPERGITVNVGTVEGGTRPNVVAQSARAGVDIRVMTTEDGRELERCIRAIQPQVPGVSVAFDGGIQVAPLERTPRNRVLWARAQAEGDALGLELEEAMAGGGSDGNTTSQYTATLDGLGCVGDGAHADHEHIVIDPTLDRCALLARLLLAPAQ